MSDIVEQEEKSWPPVPNRRDIKTDATIDFNAALLRITPWVLTSLKVSLAIELLRTIYYGSCFWFDYQGEISKSDALYAINSLVFLAAYPVLTFISTFLTIWIFLAFQTNSRSNDKLKYAIINTALLLTPFANLYAVAVKLPELIDGFISPHIEPNEQQFGANTGLLIGILWMVTVVDVSMLLLDWLVVSGLHGHLHWMTVYLLHTVWYISYGCEDILYLALISIVFRSIKPNGVKAEVLHDGQT